MSSLEKQEDAPTHALARGHDALLADSGYLSAPKKEKFGEPNFVQVSSATFAAAETAENKVAISQQVWKSMARDQNPGGELGAIAAMEQLKKGTVSADAANIASMPEAKKAFVDGAGIVNAPQSSMSKYEISKKDVARDYQVDKTPQQQLPTVAGADVSVGAKVSAPANIDDMKSTASSPKVGNPVSNDVAMQSDKSRQSAPAVPNTLRSDVAMQSDLSKQSATVVPTPVRNDISMQFNKQTTPPVPMRQHDAYKSTTSEVAKAANAANVPAKPPADYSDMATRMSSGPKVDSADLRNLMAASATDHVVGGKELSRTLDVSRPIGEVQRQLEVPKVTSELAQRQGPGSMPNGEAQKLANVDASTAFGEAKASSGVKGSAQLDSRPTLSSTAGRNDSEQKPIDTRANLEPKTLSAPQNGASIEAQKIPGSVGADERAFQAAGANAGNKIDTSINDKVDRFGSSSTDKLLGAEKAAMAAANSVPASGPTTASEKVAPPVIGGAPAATEKSLPNLAGSTAEKSGMNGAPASTAERIWVLTNGAPTTPSERVTATSPERNTVPASSPERNTVPASSPERNTVPASSPERNTVPATSLERSTVPATSPERSTAPVTAQEKTLSSTPGSVTQTASEKVVAPAAATPLANTLEKTTVPAALTAEKLAATQADKIAAIQAAVTSMNNRLSAIDGVIAVKSDKVAAAEKVSSDKTGTLQLSSNPAANSTLAAKPEATDRSLSSLSSREQASGVRSASTNDSARVEPATKNQAVVRGDVSDATATAARNSQLNGRIESAAATMRTDAAASLASKTDASIGNRLDINNIRHDASANRADGARTDASAVRADLHGSARIDSTAGNRVDTHSIGRLDAANRSDATRSTDLAGRTADAATLRNGSTISAHHVGRNPDGFTIVSGGKAVASDALTARLTGKIIGGEKRYITGVEIAAIGALVAIARVRNDAATAKANARQAELQNIFRIKGDRLQISGAFGKGFPTRELTLSAILAITGASKYRDLDPAALASVQNPLRIERTLVDASRKKDEAVASEDGAAKKENANAVEMAKEVEYITFTSIEDEIIASPEVQDSEKSENDSDEADTAGVLYRPTWLISKGETLTSIAESLFQDANLGWLIADLNSSKLTESFVDGKRVVEVRSREKLELPVAEDIENFYRNRCEKADPDNLVTIVLETQIDRDVINSRLGSLMTVSGGLVGC